MWTKNKLDAEAEEEEEGVRGAGLQAASVLRPVQSPRKEGNNYKTNYGRLEPTNKI